MAVMMSGLYDALKEAGAPDDKARIAAEEVAAHRDNISELKADMRLLKWMVGAILALEVLQFANAMIK
jgi:hypothetical protein